MITLEAIKFKRKENSDIERGTKLFSSLESREPVLLIIDNDGREVKDYYYMEKNNNVNIIPFF